MYLWMECARAFTNHMALEDVPSLAKVAQTRDAAFDGHALSHCFSERRVRRCSHVCFLIQTLVDPACDDPKLREPLAKRREPLWGRNLNQLPSALSVQQR